MASRLELHERLCAILGNRNVYYQPPASLHLTYPCIVYKKRASDTEYADNLAYINTQCYTITCIDKDPDSITPSKILKLPLCRSENSFSTNNLYHDVFVLYF